MVMEDTLMSSDTSKEASSEDSSNNEQLQRPTLSSSSSSSPIIVATPTSINPDATESIRLVTSSMPLRPALTASRTWSSSHHRQLNRRERSLSSVASPYFLTSRGQHQRSTSAAALDLDQYLDAKAKRRSLSTNDQKAGPPAAAAMNQAEAVLEDCSEEQQQEKVAVASSASSYHKSSSRSSLAKTSSCFSPSVRFEDTSSMLPSKCHHLLSDETDRWNAQQQQPQTAASTATVQRTHSNPEMELCPVCLARKECEILLKRTYSKVMITCCMSCIAHSTSIYFHVNFFFFAERYHAREKETLGPKHSPIGCEVS